MSPSGTISEAMVEALRHISRIAKDRSEDARQRIDAIIEIADGATEAAALSVPTPDTGGRPIIFMDEKGNVTTTDGEAVKAMLAAIPEPVIGKKLLPLVPALSSSPVGEMDGWQTIETAPKDGTLVDLWVRPWDAFANGNPARITDAWFDDGEWKRHLACWPHNVSSCGEPTHWMLRPTAPQGGR